MRTRGPLHEPAVALAFGALIAGGCVGTSDAGPSLAPDLPTGPAPPFTDEQGSPGSPLSGLLATTSVWVGTSDLLFWILDADGRPLADAAIAVDAELASPDGDRLPKQAARIVRPTASGRRLYLVRVVLDRVGSWQLHVRVAQEATEAGGLGSSGDPAMGLAAVIPIEVVPDDGSPPLGDPFPAIDTPTAATAAGGVAAISSLPIPDPAFYEYSVADLLERGEPFLLAIDSVAFRSTDTCGAGLGHLIHLHHEIPALRMVHAEPYRTTLEDGVLTLDPPGGPPRATLWAEELGATSPPWIFVVGRDGRLWAKFHDIFGSDELRSAIDTVLLTVNPGST